MPEQMVKDGQHHQRSAHYQHACHQRTRPGEGLGQAVSQTRPQYPWMPITRQPTQVRPQHRVKGADTAIIPAHGFTRRRRSLKHLTVGLRDPIVLPNVDHDNRAVAATHKVVRSMPGAVRPVNPKWLRQNTNDVGISVERHQLVTFNPGFMANMSPRSGEPPQAGIIPLPPKRRETPHRRAIQLELSSSTPAQPLAHEAIAGVELQVHSTRHDLPSRHRRRQHT